MVRRDFPPTPPRTLMPVHSRELSQVYTPKEIKGIPEHDVYDPKSDRPRPSECKHVRPDPKPKPGQITPKQSATPWSDVFNYTAAATIGTTEICALCLVQRCKLCHRYMTDIYYSAHKKSSCENR